jgi:hypothetical protein
VARQNPDHRSSASFFPLSGNRRPRFTSTRPPQSSWGERTQDD